MDLELFTMIRVSPNQYQKKTARIPPQYSKMNESTALVQVQPYYCYSTYFHLEEAGGK
jgi:hypothetical protein